MGPQHEPLSLVGDREGSRVLSAVAGVVSVFALVGGANGRSDTSRG